jgi:hypothetical protein
LGRSSSCSKLCQGSTRFRQKSPLPRQAWRRRPPHRKRAECERRSPPTTRSRRSSAGSAVGSRWAFWLFSRGHEQVYAAWTLDWLPGFHNVSISTLGIAIFLAGFFTVAQFSFWGNYLPKAYPVHLRGTGESFAANIGGRMLGTPFAFVTQAIVTAIAGTGAPPQQLALVTAQVAAGVALALFLVNLILSFKLPEQSATDAET